LKFRFVFLLSIAGIAVFAGACSTKKDAFVNRNWHALNTRYNVLYNGGLAFEEGRESLNSAYRDNYWEILPVERMEVSGEIRLDSEDNNPNFLLAEEKATKAIQKHSMDIGGTERNPQTDEAFLLLGKARYFDERFIPALEAFNYVLRKYEDSDKLSEARIWREKTNLRLGYEELALKNLKTLFKYDVLSDQEYADARAVAAQAYINLQVLDTAVRHMKIAAAYTRKTEEKGRYYYILGQLYNRLQYPDSADMAFDKVIEFNRKIPRVYLINAKLQKIANRELTEANSTEVREYLTDLEQDRENRPFLDKIYRSFGVYYQKIGAQGAALDYYNKSLRATRDEPYLNSLNYTDLAEYYFDQNNFKNAGAYYDSVLLNVPENSRTYRSVSKKRQNLDDVIAYESVVQQADSILALSAMSPLEREIYFQSHIDSIRAVAEAESVKKQEQARTGLEAFSQSQGGRENQGSFYFYNITSLGYGKNEFRMRWGDRELEDNWRWSTKSVVLTEATDAGADLADGGEESLPDSEKYSLDYYLARIPEDPVVLDSLRKERNFANYQLGLIYKEKFGEPMLAAARLEAVLDSDPEERLILPSKYNLYKIYQEVGSPLQESMKRDIVENHPDSRYASILANPNVALTSLQNVQEVRYAALYRAYEDQEYLEVITGAEAAIDQFTGEPVVPKLELLKANAIGRLQGFSQFREALNYIALNYPNTPEGQKARAIVEDQIPKLESTEFTDASTARATANWKLVFPFNRTRSQEAQELKKRLEKSMEELGYRYTVSRDIYDLETEFVVVHGFASESYALGYAELLRNNRKYRISNENFVILSDNYKVVQVHKNLADYRAQVQTPKS
jgi:hypothetical protein